MSRGQDWNELVDQLAVMRSRDPEATLMVVTLQQLSGVVIAGAVAGSIAGAILTFLALGISRLLS